MCFIFSRGIRKIFINLKTQIKPNNGIAHINIIGLIDLDYMTKTWETKNKILKFMRSGKKMPSEICDEFGLSPATVTQHLQELEAMGAIRKVDNPFVKKWKYFEPNPEFNIKIIGNGGSMTKTKTPYIIALVAMLVAIGAIAFVATQLMNSAGVAQVTVPVRLTDPPTVPNGTQALLISYSSVAVHFNGGSNATGWISAAGNGSINLLSLINESEVIGSVTIPKNSIVDMIRFNVTSASIEINGTYYNVTVPSRSVLAHVSGRGNVNSSAGLLLDLSPVVATIYTNMSTIFVLVPSVRAVVAPNGNTSTFIGTRAQISEYERTHLETAKANISITSATLSQTGNATNFSITVRNNGNQSVLLSHVLIYGNDTITINPEIVLPGSISGNVSAGEGIGSGSGERISNLSGSNIVISSNAPNSTSTIPNSKNRTAVANISIKTNITVQDRPYVTGAFGEGIGTRMNITANMTGLQIEEQKSEHGGIWVLVNGSRVMINSSDSGMPLLGREDVSSLFKVSKNIVSMRVLNFQITPNGQLFLPFSSGCIKPYDKLSVNSSGGAIAATNNSSASVCGYEDIPRMIDEGYTLEPGESATFTFSGKVGLAFGRIIISPISGENYSIVVAGIDGASGSTKITAT